MEPPIRPTPRIAILIAPGSASVAPGAHGARELVDRAHGLIPRHARVGDRLAVGQLGGPVELLAALEKVADDATVRCVVLTGTPVPAGTTSKVPATASI
jgi:hypothetical protein